MPKIERPVFVTNDDRRARRLRRGAFVATALACLWLVGLGVGLFGFGGMPGVSFLKGGDDEKQRSEAPPAQQPGGDAVAWQTRLVGRRGLLARSGDARAKASQRAARAGQGFTPATPPAAPPPGAMPPPQQPVNPAGRTRGWARKGHPAPPGQVRKTQPPPPPGSPGRRRGQQTTTTTTTPLPPGQAKKTPPPPPPG